MTESSWYAERFDATYLEAYAHRDASEAVRAAGALIEPLGVRGRRVLDLACGAGRYLEAVNALGAHVVGLDLSMALLRAARAGKAAPPDVVRADVRSLPFVAGAFDGVISMFTSFGYFPTAAEDASVLQEAARVLAPGGFLVLDVFNAAAVARTLAPESERQSGRWTLHERRWLAGGRVHKDITMRAGAEVRTYHETVRLWPAPALVAAVAAAGFRVEPLRGDYDGAAFEPDRSPRTIVIARRAATGAGGP